MVLDLDETLVHSHTDGYVILYCDTLFLFA